MKSTIHFFGDSFTEGHSLSTLPGIWPKLLCKGLGYKYKNYALGGASSLFIIHQLIKGLSEVKSGDKAIVLETIPDRTEVYSDRLKRIVPVTNGHLAHDLKLLTLDPTKDSTEYFRSKEELVSATNFIYDHRSEKIEHFAKYYTGIFKDFKKYYESIGVEFILLSYQLSFNNVKYAKKFETNFNLSKGKSKDIHFTLKGHWQFAKYISDKYFNGEVELPEIPKKANYII